MSQSPKLCKMQVAIFGETNSGKSALFNAITGTNTAIVSEISGTTTDPIAKVMELIGFGPIVLIDTAGLNDRSELGSARMKKTAQTLNRTEFAYYVIDVDNFCEQEYIDMQEQFEKRKIPHKIIFSKSDTRDLDKINELKEKYNNSLVISINSNKDIDEVREDLISELNKICENTKQDTLVGDFLQPHSVVVMVVPIDSEAPKGRLILPQVQLIRDCLDNGIRCNVTTLEELGLCLSQSLQVDLVVCDSQIFKEVSEIVPKEMKLTSFSVLLARQKVELQELIDGLNAIEKLCDGDKILISEVCTHNTSHEDIGRVKIPATIKRITNKNLQIDFSTGRDYPENLNEYKLVLHCGGCMVGKKEMQQRVAIARESSVPITNYGIFLAYASGILDRMNIWNQ